MKIQLLSDLHLEMRRDFPESLVVEDIDVLVLAGDIDVGRTNVKKRLQFFADRYKRVLYTPGNHEYYHGLEIGAFREMTVPDNVTIMDRNVTIIDDVWFAGATLWTNFRGDPKVRATAERYINDFKRIGGNNIAARMEEEFYAAVKMFDDVRDAVGKKVFISHFLPAVECVHPKWMQEPLTRMLNGYFANDMGDWIGAMENAVWLFGHTHDRMDFMLGNTRMISNPLGYPGENKEEYVPCIVSM